MVFTAMENRLVRFPSSFGLWVTSLDTLTQAHSFYVIARPPSACRADCQDHRGQQSAQKEQYLGPLPQPPATSASYRAGDRGDCLSLDMGHTLARVPIAQLGYPRHNLDLGGWLPMIVPNLWRAPRSLRGTSHEPIPLTPTLSALSLMPAVPTRLNSLGGQESRHGNTGSFRAVGCLRATSSSRP